MAVVAGWVDVVFEVSPAAVTVGSAEGGTNGGGEGRSPEDGIEFAGGVRHEVQDLLCGSVPSSVASTCIAHSCAPGAAVGCAGPAVGWDIARVGKGLIYGCHLGLAHRAGPGSIVGAIGLIGRNPEQVPFADHVRMQGGVIGNAISVVVEQLVEHVRDVISLRWTRRPCRGGDADGHTKDVGDASAR